MWTSRGQFGVFPLAYDNRSTLACLVVICASHCSTFLLTTVRCDRCMAQAPSALFALVTLPLLLHVLIRPTPLEESEDFRQLATTELDRMGPWKRQEKMLVGVFVMLLALWATEDQTGLHTAGIALWGVAVLLCLGLLRLDDVLGAKKAWSIMIYLGGMLSIVNGLIDLGVIAWLANAMQNALHGLTGVPAAIVIGLFYFFSMCELPVCTLSCLLDKAAPFAHPEWCSDSSLHAPLRHSRVMLPVGATPSLANCVTLCVSSRSQSRCIHSGLCQVWILYV